MEKIINNIIFFDGECGLCHKLVNFVTTKDTKNIFSFVPLKSDRAKKLLPQSLQTTDSVTVLQNGVFYQKSAACFLVLSQLKTVWSGLLIFEYLPKKLLDFFYELIAKNRLFIFGKKITVKFYKKIIK